MTIPGNDHWANEIDDLMAQLETILDRLDQMDLPLPAVRIAEAIEILTQAKSIPRDKRDSF